MSSLCYCLKAFPFGLEEAPGLPCGPVVIHRAVNKGRTFSYPNPWEDSPLPAPWVGPLPKVPEILIFFTVLLVLLVTWTLTLMGSPW